MQRNLKQCGRKETTDSLRETEINNEFLHDAVDLVVLLPRPIVVPRQIMIRRGVLYHEVRFWQTAVMA